MTELRPPVAVEAETGAQQTAISALLDEADKYPLENGTIGFSFTRDQMIALLKECTPRMNSISVIPSYRDGDMTSFEITTYVSFARSELTPSPGQE